MPKDAWSLRLSWNYASKGSVHKDYDIVPKDDRSLRVSWNYAPKGSVPKNVRSLRNDYRGGSGGNGTGEG